ncbi:hypothetical protein [Streptomyces ficellus]|uniref:Uncharacterized protein n=1 Tax=Streptomyces ficellus TaxID=1977088 RepID=A0A6I6F5S7_9ACTN|nr:hypothetical protein [Streptomyces ficellus]QGV79020.1 hypothetical protein EIZ62_12740 [Streptomyces ficellus]
MPSRSPLPPPPPPVHLRTWPDREALLADRALAVGELNRRVLGGRRLTYFLVTLVGLQLGWGLVGAGLTAFDGPGDPLTATVAGLTIVLGLVVLVPLVVAVVLGVRHDRSARARLLQWAALDPAAIRDARFRAPGLSVAWLLLSFAQCAAGLWLSFAVPAAARPGDTTYTEVAYAMGAGLILWVSGLLGAVKAVGHRRLVLRLAPRA